MNSESNISSRPVAVPIGLGQLKSLIAALPGRLAGISQERASTKPSPESWSAKQELGHLIDSAANNHQRIARAQLEDNLALPGYDGDRWVEIHGYHNREWNDLIAQWRSGDAQLLAAAKAAPQEAWSHPLTVGGSEPMTLEFVLDDYVAHMASHLRHIGVKVDDILAATTSAPYPEKPAPANNPINDLMRRRW